MLPGETILSGGPATCEDCGVTPKLDVYRSAAGYYIGTYCNCGPYSRESGYYPTHEAAQKAFATDFARTTVTELAPNQVFLDPATKDGSWVVFFNGEVVASGYNSKGAAEAALGLYVSGYRKSRK